MLVNVSISWPNGISVDYEVWVQAGPWSPWAIQTLCSGGGSPYPMLFFPLTLPVMRPHLVGRCGPRVVLGSSGPAPDPEWDS